MRYVKLFYYDLVTHTVSYCELLQTIISLLLIVKLRQGSGKDRQGMAVKAKASKLKPLPRAYIKVGCHPPPPEV